MSDDAVEAVHGVRCGREMAHVSCALIVGHEGMHQYLVGGDDHWQIVRTIAEEAERRGRLAAVSEFVERLRANGHWNDAWWIDWAAMDDPEWRLKAAKTALESEREVQG